MKYVGGDGPGGWDEPAKRCLPGPEFTGQHPRLSMGGRFSNSALLGSVDARLCLTIQVAGIKPGPGPSVPAYVAPWPIVWDDYGSAKLVDPRGTR